MILITGASGKTGRSIIRHLKNSGEGVRALVHRADQAGLIKTAGAAEVVLGDLESQVDLAKASQGVRALYHICPNMHLREVSIGRNVLEAAINAKVERFVYHSVLHPQTEEMPHHWNKLRVEEMIFTTGLTYTILQPCAYMQNVLGYWSKITGENVFPVPYSLEARLSMVDLEDVARVASRVLVEPGHENATYELCGPEALTQNDVAKILGRVLGKSVKAVRLELDTWEKQARSGGMNDYARQTLLKMFAYYDRFGLIGSPSVLAWLLRRQPTTFEEFVSRTVLERNESPAN